MKRTVIVVLALVAMFLLPNLALADNVEDFGRCYEALSSQDYLRCIQYCSVLADNEDLGEELRSMSLSNRGICYEFESDLRRAMDDHTHALRLFPGNVAAYSNRAFIYVKTGELGKAKVDTAKALELNPNAKVPVFEKFS
ncbi:MAG: tetratricopeptide repeat protein, partial [Proteobacteria bacterium]|nr:tetratricopeptide repeat protein [Pseudomonadota bacterium]MBU1610287.1 tetratricopeptide repeat protein [Pseudomonadota bacterium]